LKEFVELQGVAEKLFGFINKFVFDKDRKTLSIIQGYQDFENFLNVNLFQSENFKLRQETGRGFREILFKCSGDADLTSTIVFLLGILINKTIPLAPTQNRRSF
jgi:hypothetical protein